LKSITRKKIAILGIKGLPSKGGAERVVEAIVNNLHHEFDFSVYSIDSYSKDFQPKDIRLIKLKNFGGKHLSSFSLFIFSAVHALLFEKYDLIHIHNTDAGFIVPMLRIKYKVIGTSHGYAYKREKWNRIAKFFLKRSEAIFLKFSNVITSVSKSISYELNMRTKKEVIFIPNGIDEPKWIENVSLKDEYKLRETDYLCFAAGRIDPTKGCHFLLEAFKNITSDLNLVVIGDFTHKKDYSDDLYRMADDKVKFIPFIENKKTLFGIIKNAKLFILPSTVEAMSIMLLEVAALGIPIICSDIPENVCVLEDNTIYFKSGHEKDLKEKIEFCLDNYEEISGKAKRTKDWILKQYRWEIISDEYRKLYNNILFSGHCPKVTR